MPPCSFGAMRARPREVAIHSAPSYHSKSKTLPPRPCAAPMKGPRRGQGHAEQVAFGRRPQAALVVGAQRGDAEAAERDVVAQLVVGAEAEQVAVQRADHEAAVGQRQHHVGVRAAQFLAGVFRQRTDALRVGAVQAVFADQQAPARAVDHAGQGLFLEQFAARLEHATCRRRSGEKPTPSMRAYSCVALREDGALVLAHRPVLDASCGRS